jgi:hypothetical protein
MLINFKFMTNVERGIPEDVVRAPETPETSNKVEISGKQIDTIKDEARRLTREAFTSIYEGELHRVSDIKSAKAEGFRRALVGVGAISEKESQQLVREAQQSASRTAHYEEGVEKRQTVCEISERKKDELIASLRECLSQAFKARYENRSQVEIARVTGFADGEMGFVVKAGLMTEKEVQELVGNTRRDVLKSMQEKRY